MFDTGVVSHTSPGMRTCYSHVLLGLTFYLVSRVITQVRILLRELHNQPCVAVLFQPKFCDRRLCSTLHLDMRFLAEYSCLVTQIWRLLKILPDKPLVSVLFRTKFRDLPFTSSQHHFLTDNSARTYLLPLRDMQSSVRFIHVTLKSFQLCSMQRKCKTNQNKPKWSSLIYCYISLLPVD